MGAEVHVQVQHRPQSLQLAQAACVLAAIEIVHRLPHLQRLEPLNSCTKQRARSIPAGITTTQGQPKRKAVSGHSPQLEQIKVYRLYVVRECDVRSCKG